MLLKIFPYCAKSDVCSALTETYRFDLGTLTMCREEYEAAVAAFIRGNRITRCPTACALPTQAAPAADRAALQRYAVLRSQSRRQQAAGQDRSF